MQQASGYRVEGMYWPFPLLLLLAALSLSAQGLAASPTEGMRSTSTARSAAARPVEPPRRQRVSPAALAAARRFLCPYGGTPQGRGRCTRGAGIGAAGTGIGGGTGWLGDDPEVRDWDRGLAPPTRAQVPCPPGTTAATVRDQPQVTRCVAD